MKKDKRKTGNSRRADSNRRDVARRMMTNAKEETDGSGFDSDGNNRGKKTDNHLNGERSSKRMVKDFFQRRKTEKKRQKE